MMAGGADRQWMIPAAAGLAAIETIALAAVLLMRDTRTAPFYIFCIALKLPFCAMLVRRGAGAWLAVLLWEATGLFAAVVAPGIPLALRTLVLVLAGTVTAMLFLVLPLFPRMELPQR